MKVWAFELFLDNFVFFLSITCTTRPVDGNSAMNKGLYTGILVTEVGDRLCFHGLVEFFFSCWLLLSSYISNLVLKLIVH